MDLPTAIVDDDDGEVPVTQAVVTTTCEGPPTPLTPVGSLLIEVNVRYK